MKKLTTKTLVTMAVYLALFVVLDRVSDTLNLFKMASGGKLNFGPIILLLSSYHLGWKNGTFVAFVSVLVQLVIGSVSFYGIESFLLDYLVAYSVYGLASLFPNFKYFFSGVLITSILRLISSTLAGTIVWETPLWGSFTYNAAYMIPTTVAALILVPILYTALKPVFKK